MAFPFLFERTVTTKVGDHDSCIPGPSYAMPPEPPAPPERTPQDALQEAYIAAADKAKEMDATAATPDDLRKVVSILEKIEGSYLKNSRVFVMH